MGRSMYLVRPVPALVAFPDGVHLASNAVVAFVRAFSSRKARGKLLLIGQNKSADQRDIAI